jgi:hypothetical protein
MLMEISRDGDGKVTFVIASRSETVIQETSC